MRGRFVAAVLAAAAAFVAACGEDSHPAASPSGAASITVTSPDVTDGSTVPRNFTCDGSNTSPALQWTGAPANTAALAIVVDDPDAPDGTYTHWVVLDILPTVHSVEAGGVPPGAVQAKNSAGKPAYTGPCPQGGTHHYRFTVYALSGPTGLDSGVALDVALRAVTERSVAWGRLAATYSR